MSWRSRASRSGPSRSSTGASAGFDKRFRSFNGYIISGRGRTVFFAGDSAGYEPDIDSPTVFAQRGFPMCAVDWRQRVGIDSVDLCILPIGDYYYRSNHMSPEEAWDIFQQLEGQWFLPIHWRTFITSPTEHEPIFEPIERLDAAAGDRRNRIVAREPGGISIARA